MEFAFVPLQCSLLNPCKHLFQAYIPNRTIAACPARACFHLLPPHQARRRPAGQPASGRWTPFVGLCNVLDEWIDHLVEHLPLPTSVDPSHTLANNFAPVDELPPTECTPIDGQLPPCLNGAYLRNGSNPQLVPPQGCHPFEGDGMVHALVICDGRATLCSRYVRTYKYEVERQLGMRPAFPCPFSAFYSLFGLARVGVLLLRILTWQLSFKQGCGTANTSLCFFNNTLMALCENDLPYAMRLTPSGDLETVKRFDFNGKLVSSMTAHPKIDPETREMFAFRYDFLSPPFLSYYYVNADGKKQPDVPIGSLVRPSMFHDFAITKSYSIFVEPQIVIKPVDMFMGKGPPFAFDASKLPRAGVIPRYATEGSSIKWVDVPGINFLHTINAWDEKEDEVVLVGVNAQPVEHMIHRIELVRWTVEMVGINLREGRMTLRKRLSSMSLEFGVINPEFLGRRNRYVYMAMADRLPKTSGIVKLDLARVHVHVDDGDEDRCCIVGMRCFGEGCFGGEPFFVARDDGDGEEDDGYLVSYVHNERRNESRFIVMDAKSPELDIVASVKLPQRVPYGFHGLFVKAADLKKQKV